MAPYPRPIRRSFRISKAARATSTLTGEESEATGGRWNSPGRRAVYLSGNLALAMLEAIVHIDDDEEFLRTHYVYQLITFPEDSVASLREEDLPAGWNSQSVSATSQRLGDDWLSGLKTPVLAVPSVLVPPDLRFDPGHLNYVLNPAHPSFEASVDVGQPRPLRFDERLAIRSDRTRP